MILNIICLATALISLLFATRCYWELHKWARQCQNARIAIAYKRKVQLHAPLTEWLGWINQLDKDRDSNGRVVYAMGGTRVAITKAPRKITKPKPVESSGGEGGSIRGGVAA